MKKVLIILVLLIAGFVIYGATLGLFEKVVVNVTKVGPYKFVYAEHKGSYMKVGKVMNNIFKSLDKDFGIKAERGFGVYYDNPKLVKKENLRSSVGCVLESEYFDDEDKIKTKFGIMEYPVTQSITAEFPYKNMGSIIVAVAKVYPEFSKYMEANGFEQTESLEIYSMKDKKIFFSMPLKKKQGAQ